MYKKLRRWEIAAFILTGITGPLLHFTYFWSGDNSIIAAFSSVNESTWEHMKLLFVPAFFITLIEMVVFTERYHNFLAAKFLSILLGLVAIPALYYTYTGIWGKSNTIIDIAVFYVAAALTYWVGYRLLERGKFTGGALQIAGLLGLWAIAFLFVWFTYSPPEIALFRDPISGLYGIS